MFKNNAPAIVDYTLRFPFQFGIGIDFPNLTKSLERNLGELSFSLFRQNYFYVLEIKGFKSENSAKDYLMRLWAGMAWVSLNKCIPFSAKTELGEITYAPDPQIAAENLSRSFGMSIKGAVDGLAGGDQDPIVFPSVKKIRTISFSASGSSSSPLSFDDIYPILIQGIEAPVSFDIMLDSKLKLAIELYSAHYYEHTTNTKFLTLIMALECFFPNKPESKSGVALELLNDWKTEIEDKKSKLQPDDEEYISLEDLKRELHFMKEKSKRGLIRSLVFETLQAVNNPQAQEFAKEAVGLYDKRSKLVHKGKLPPKDLDNAEKEAKQLVEMILKAKFRINANMIKEDI